MPSFRKGGTYTFRIVPSGYEFLGPGNQVLYQVPRNHNDAVAKSHDLAYGRILDKGLNPYFSYSEADEEFLRDLKPDDIPTYFANYAFYGKKYLAQLGFIDSIPGMSFGNLPCPPSIKALALARSLKSMPGVMLTLFLIRRINQVILLVASKKM